VVKRNTEDSRRVSAKDLNLRGEKSFLLKKVKRKRGEIRVTRKKNTEKCSNAIPLRPAIGELSEFV